MKDKKCVIVTYEKTEDGFGISLSKNYTNDDLIKIHHLLSIIVNDD